MSHLKTRIFTVIILILCLNACSNNADSVHQTPLPTAARQIEPTNLGIGSGEVVTATPVGIAEKVIPEEVEIVTLKIPESIDAASFEYSGLAWFGENLVLLPQFPEGKDFSRDPNLFSIAKKDLLRSVQNPDLELPIRSVPIINSDLRKVIEGFEGFESILFVDQTVYLTIESRAGNPMMGYLIKGEVQGDLESITLDPDSLVRLEPFTSERNATFEAMTCRNDKIYVIYEHNSEKNGRQPVAYEFNLELKMEREIPFPAINFRITDATISDASGKFWVMNYFFPGDAHLAVEQDDLVLKYGEGKTHAENEPVERLVQLQIENEAITRVDQPPIYLQLLPLNVARNWEGIAQLDESGFLLIVDSFPGSMLGFCPLIR